MAKVALLIGVSEYKSGLNPLPKAVNDVEAMQRVLAHPEMGDFAEANITVLKNPHRQEMEEAIYRLFTNRQREDSLVFYFSGHGLKDESGRFYLSTAITRQENGRLVKHSAVAGTFLQESINESKSEKIVIILDSSFSGTLARGMTIDSTEMALLTSCTSTQYSFELADEELSIYTLHLVEGIETGAADRDGDGWIRVNELHEYASHKVKEVAPAMTPKFYPMGEGYRIVLAKAPIRHPAKYQEVQAIARDENQAIIFQERVELENLKQELEVQRAQFEFERTQLKRNFYNSIIHSKNLQLLASQLANNSADVAIILQTIEAQQINRNDQIWLLKALLENDALEEWRLSEASQLLLQKLTQLSEREEVLTSLDNDSDARERQLVRQNSLIGTRDALVVGINQYPFLKDTPTSRSKHLSIPASDAEAIAQCLEEYGGFRVRRLPETIQEGQRRVAAGAIVQTDTLEDAIIRLFNPVGESIPETALLYFGGHGFRKNRGGVTEGFLATSDTHPQKNQWGVSLRWLRELLQKSPVRQQIIWLDCSYSGELLNFSEVDIEYKNGRDRCFIVATRDFEDSHVTIEGDRGVLSKALLQGLDPKRQPDKQVTSQTLVHFITQTLKNAPQHPICVSSGS